MNSKNNFDIIVVGAGHAGIEAALVGSRLGQSTLLITSNASRIGYMSCNPAIGGLAKGHMVREIDALGGQMGLTTDLTTIQFKRLNATKGPAVRGSRSQCDKDRYSLMMQKVLAAQESLDVLEGEVKSLVLENEVCRGVVLQDSSIVYARAVVITTGTFMNGVMHVGLQQIAGGRVGDKATTGLSDQLRDHGFKVQRLKTGTPPRLRRDSIDWSKTLAQAGDEKPYPFSFRSEPKWHLPQILCYLSYTNEKTHDIIRANLDKSPIYCGMIEGTGPRYCPSIEDKIVRFSEKAQHQTFLEPEGLDTDSIYLQGISTSLPADIQDLFLRTILGLENVQVLRYGYAVEYDFFEPTQIQHSLETRSIQNLFLAGQINGTSGYEEAAAQGMIAGINAVQKLLEREPLVLTRDQAYVGVLIDDLVTKGTQEPYRMFTSRAEHRLVLREDNTLDRLIGIGYDLGLVSTQTMDAFLRQQEERKVFSRLLETPVYPTPAFNERLLKAGSTPLNKASDYKTLLRRPELCIASLPDLGLECNLEPNITEAVEIEVKYWGYIQRQNEMIKQSLRLENYKIPIDLIYSSVRGLSTEEIEKLSQVRPMTLGQASRISGVNPSAIQAIMVCLKAHRNTQRESAQWNAHRRQILQNLRGVSRSGSPI